LRGVPKPTFSSDSHFPEPTGDTPLKNELLKNAIKVIPDPNILINMVSRRAKQLKQGHKPLIESLEKLEPEDIAMREIIEGKIDYQLFEEEDPVYT
jgi:DNA-directed RNA polymerase subunit omega